MRTKDKEPRPPTHRLSAEDFRLRHQFCISPGEARSIWQRAKDRGIIVGERWPEARFKLSGTDATKSYKAHCDHPEDGFCGLSISQENLDRVNERLGFRIKTRGEAIEEFRQERARHEKPEPIRGDQLEIPETSQEPEGELIEVEPSTIPSNTEKPQKKEKLPPNVTVINKEDALKKAMEILNRINKK